MAKQEAARGPRGPDVLANVQIAFPLTFSLFATIMLVGITAAYAWDTKSLKDTLIFFLAGAAAVGQITAAFYTARMLAATLSIRSEDIGYASRVKAFSFGERWNDPAMYHARDTLREVLDHDGSHDQLVDVIEKKRTNVIHVMNFLEEIGTAVRCRVADDEIAKMQFSFVVTSTWSKCLPWIHDHRRRRGQNALWEDLEALYDAWK